MIKEKQMQLVKEGQIETNEQFLSECSEEDASMIASDPNLTPKQKFSAMMDPEGYRFKKNNPYLIKDAENYPALFKNLSDPNSFVVSKHYQNEFAKYEQQLKQITKTQGPFENAWNASRYAYETMKLNDLTAEKMDAIKENDAEKIKDIEKKINEQSEVIAEMTPNSRGGFSGTFGSVVASVGRELPTLAVTGVATAFLGASTPATGGITAPAAAVTAGRFAMTIDKIRKGLAAYRATRAAMVVGRGAPAINRIASASIIYNDTTNVARGAMYDYLSKTYPEMKEEEKQQKSWTSGRLEGAFETATSLVGLSGLGAKTAYNVSSRQILKRNIIKTIEGGVADDVEKEAAKNAIRVMVDKGVITSEMVQSNSFVRNLTNKIVKLRESRLGKTASFGSEMGVEGITEVYQNEIQKEIQNQKVGETMGYSDAITNATDNISGYVQEIYDYAVNGKPMSEDASEALDTLVNVGLSSAVIGGAFTGIDYASKRVFRNKAQSLGNQLDNANKTINTFDNILEQKNNSEANKKAPGVVSDFYKNAKKSGELPDNIYVRIDRLKQILEEAKKDPVAMAKLNSLKVAEKIEDAEKDGGLVEFDTNDFIDTVVDPSNDTLYQKIKGDISSNPAMNSKNDILEMVDMATKNDQLMKEAVSDKGSVYNYILKQQTDAGATKELATVNAVIGQTMFNTFYRMRTDGKTMQQIVDQIKLRLENVDVITDGDLKMYVGMASKTAVVEDYNKAKDMFSKGSNVKDILKETGWFLDPNDNMWKYEISDKDATLDTDLLKKMFSNKTGEQKLSDILKHEKLFKAHPELSNVIVSYNSHLRAAGGQAYMENGVLKIDLAKTSDFERLKSIILHEVQHNIQRIEGFGRGGAPKAYSTPLPDDLIPTWNERIMLHRDLWKALKDSGVKTSSDMISHASIQDARPLLEKLAKKDTSLQQKLKRLDELDSRLKKVDAGDRFMKYYNIPGENEARDTQAREKMTEQERRDVLPANVDGRRAPVVRFSVGDEIVETKTDVDVDPVEQIAGSISFGVETILRLSKVSNPTTFAHEMFHLFGRQLFKNFNNGVLTERWSKHAVVLADFLGLEKTEDGRYVFEGNESAEEKLAEAGTSYLKTGKAPASYLKEIFDIIGEWFAEVYNAIRRSEIPLDKKVTKVFDEIFVPYEKQKQIMLERRYGIIQKPENMTDEQYMDYIAQKRAATARGTTEETKTASKLHEVMSNETYRAEYEEAYRKAYEELGLLPIYQLLDYVGTEKISRSSLKKISKDISIPRTYLSSKAGLDISQVFAKFSELAKDINDFAKLLSETPSKDSTAQYMAEAHMKKWLQENYPDLAELDSELAARNEAVFKLSVMEYMMLAGIEMERFNQIYNDMTTVAEYMVQRMPLKKIINTQRWIEQESKIMQKYDIELSNKKRAEIKRQQAFLNYYAMRSKKLRSQSVKFIKRTKKYRGPQTKEILKTIDGDTFDLLKSILNRFGVTKATPNTNVPLGARIEDWVEQMSENGYSGADEISKYASTLVAGVEGSMNTSDFEFLIEAFGFIESVGKTQKQILIGEQKILVEDASQSILSLFEENNIKPLEKELGMAVMLEPVIRELVPERVFLDWFAPFFNGLTKRDMQIQTWRNQLASIIKPFAKDLNKSITIDGKTFTIEQLLVMMLNSGNRHNINCMVKTIQQKTGDVSFNVDAMFSFVDQSPKYLREATRKIWQIFEDNKGVFQDVQRKIDGKVLRFVEAEPYVFSDGEEMPGGYYPSGKISVAKDFEKSTNKFKNSGTYATKSFQKERTFAHGDLDLTLGTLNSWFYKMAGTIHLALPYNNIGKLLRNGTFRATVGEGLVKSIGDWMDSATTPEKTNQLLSAVNQFASVSVLGLNFVKVFTQMSGMIPAMAEIGPSHIMKSLATTNPIRAINNAAKLSDYMKTRYEHPEDHLHLYLKADNLVGSAIQGLDKVQASKIMNFAMFFIIYGDAIASEVTWKAEFDRSIQKGYSRSEASDLADSAVRRLQGDSSAGSRPKLLQGDKKYFTMFASYFIGIHSMLVAKKIKGDYVKLCALLFAAAVAAPMFEALFSTARDWMFADEEDKKKFKREKISNVYDLYAKEALQNVVSSASSFWLPHFGIGGYVGSAITEGKVYSPRNVQIEYMLKPISATTAFVKSAKLASEGKRKKAEQQAKKGLKTIFEFGMINSRVSDSLSEIILGE